MTDTYFGGMLPPGRADEESADAGVMEPGAPSEAVLVGTASPLRLRLEPIEHHLTPDGTVCIGTFLGDNLLSRCALPKQTAEDFLDMELFEHPVSLALNVTSGGPGLEGNLLALAPMPEAGAPQPDSEPWKDSVPGAGYEAVVGGEPDEGEEQLVGVFLGQVVRFEKDRKFPDSLAKEAADMLASVVRGRIGNVVDRVIEELAGPSAGAE